MCIGMLSWIGSHRIGRAAIEFLGHMRADPRLAKTVADHVFPGPVGIGSLLDPQAKALSAFAGFGCGFLVIGPVADETLEPSDWIIDLPNGSVVHCGRTPTISYAEAADRLSQLGCDHVSVFAQLATVSDEIVASLVPHVAGFIVQAKDAQHFHSLRLGFDGPLLIEATTADIEYSGVEIASGIYLSGESSQELHRAVTRARRSLGEKVILCGGSLSPQESHSLLKAGADLVFVDAGLAISGPGLVKRTNEALLSLLPAPDVEPLSLDAARQSWFWGLMLGVAVFVGGILATILASSRVILPYDETLCGIPRGAFEGINPRLLPFMAHDRMTLAGSMLSIGILYGAIAWNGIRYGLHWAKIAIILSSGVGFFSFFLFLGYGYFDPFHGFVTSVVVQFVFFIMLTPLGKAHPPADSEWTETPEWCRGQWGQLLFIGMGIGLTVAGLVISYVGCTLVFVETDFEFLQITAAEALVGTDRLIPLIAHDRASLGGMLLSNGIIIWLAAQWGIRAGTRWLWCAFAWAGNIAFSAAIGVHVAVGYQSWEHVAPAAAGWLVWIIALCLTKGWMCRVSSSEGMIRVIPPSGVGVEW